MKPRHTTFTLAMVIMRLTLLTQSVLSGLFLMTSACAGANYHVSASHESGNYPVQEDDWCEDHQSYHHDEVDDGYSDHDEVEVYIEHEESRPRRHRRRAVHVEHEVQGAYYETASSGYTSCGTFLAKNNGENICQPGQYCADATFSNCALGCLSDANCTGAQVCVKNQGGQVGVCHAAAY